MIEWKLNLQDYVLLVTAANALVEVTARGLLQFTNCEGELFELAQTHYEDALRFKETVKSIASATESTIKT